jgi:hypothetical protein
MLHLDERFSFESAAWGHQKGKVAIPSHGLPIVFQVMRRLSANTANIPINRTFSAAGSKRCGSARFLRESPRTRSIPE